MAASRQSRGMGRPHGAATVFFVLSPLAGLGGGPGPERRLTPVAAMLLIRRGVKYLEVKYTASAINDWRNGTVAGGSCPILMRPDA